ncbi:MAG: hypothetical protein IMX00_05000 [Limnochordales bacterium]|nr:hypothetical protein [Limnochordales bacterium]
MRTAANFAAKVEQKIQEREAFKTWHVQATGDCLLDVNEQLALREAGVNHASVAAITGVPDEVATAALDGRGGQDVRYGSLTFAPKRAFSDAVKRLRKRRFSRGGDG